MKAINTDIMPIQISSEVFTEISWKNYNSIDIGTSIDANKIVPIFEMYIRSKEYELGLNRNLWSDKKLKEFEDEFARKYLN